MDRDGITKLILLQVCFISAAGAAAVAVRYGQQRRRKQTPPMLDSRLIPKIHFFTDSGSLQDLETFSNYFARQLGFKDATECPKLAKLSYQYLKRANGCEENIFSFLSQASDPESLYVKLIQELDRCILGYFAFHWNYATELISQVLLADTEQKRKLKGMVMEATRKQRFERVTRNLKVVRIFSTLVEEMKAIKDDTMVAADLSDRSPVLLLMGGGMGAGKSTVLKDILKGAFWSKAATKAVVVEADAFKETDIVYRTINSMGHHKDMLQTAELVHQSSTDAASSLLVTALNEGRDVIMDGTLAWEPFVEQTIAMARSVHKHRYRMGVGYKVADDGSVTENYWEQIQNDDTNESDEFSHRKHYRIELVGVVCDAYLAVVRGIRRAIFMGRAVRVRSQLVSHKRFATAFPKYCHLVDNARLYSSNSTGAPKLIAWKEGENNLLVDTEEIGCLKELSELNENAQSALELYANLNAKCGSYSCWNDAVLCESRDADQRDVKAAVEVIEKQALPVTSVHA